MFEIKSFRRFKIGSVIVAMTFVFVMFQNFSPLPLAKLKPQMMSAHARAMAAVEGTADMRNLAPERPLNYGSSAIAAPQSGSDLDSISQDWLTRQTNMITGGAEQRFLEDVNKRMTRMLQSEDPMEEKQGASQASTARGPASVEPESEYFGMKPTSLRVMAINRFQVGFSNSTQLSCAIEGSSVRWDVTRSLGSSFDVNLRHESANSKSSVLLNYSW